jgi:putrescine transport system permease protein
MRRFALIIVPYLWLFALFLVPFAIVLKISLSDVALARPPYMPQFDWATGIWTFLSELDFENFVWLTQDDLYWKAYLSSLQIAFFSTVLTLLAGYPIAYGMARAPSEWRATLMMLVILPIYSALERMDESLIEAAEDLGCSRLSAFWLVTIPLSKPGIIAGCFLVFIPTLGEFVIPSLLGGSDTLMIGKVLWEEFFSNRDWPVASAVAVVLLLLLIVPIVLFQRNQQKQQEAEQ